MHKPIRQGDVYLDPISCAREDVNSIVDTIVLALGERTGHAHVLEAAGLKIARAPNGRGAWDPVEIVVVPEGGALLRHGTPAKGFADGDHAQINVPPGMWRIRIQRQLNSSRDID